MQFNVYTETTVFLVLSMLILTFLPQSSYFAGITIITTVTPMTMTIATIPPMMAAVSDDADDDDDDDDVASDEEDEQKYYDRWNAYSAVCHASFCCSIY